MPQSGAQSIPILSAPGATAELYRLTLGEPIGPGHETILNTLNKWKNYANGPAYLAVENFVGTEPLWDKVPLIFAQEHPDNDLVVNDLQAALASVTDYKGRPGSIPGYVSNTQVETSGQPRITMTTTFTDPEVQALYDAGLLSLSHGMYADNDEADHLVGKVRPNHVLVFVQDQKNQPVDQGAMFLSKSQGGDLMQQFQGIGKKISEAHRTKFKAALDVFHAIYNEMVGGTDDREAKDGSPAVPPNPPNYGKSTGSWSKPAEKDFGEAPFSEIRRCFAYDDGSGNFGGLKLGHHNPNGDVVKAGVDNAMARLPQTQGLGSLEAAVRAHLEKHQTDDFEESPKKTSKETDPMDTVLQEQLAAKTAENEQLKKDLTDTKAQLTTLTAKVTEMQAKADAEAETARKTKADADWLLAKSTVVDVGKIHKSEDEAAARLIFEKSPAEFLATYCAKKPADPRKEDGSQFAAGPGGDQKNAKDKDKDDSLAISRELRQSTGRMNMR